ncbi:peptide-methionine (S)-S-oxide reductase MsrA [Rheinheimera sp. UJ63]|uniref:peptide-methionine (S)-S-oxide reductase MsrA n=1 Tax=Rheinheimera sp. UJ63 TaxID=2910157 RepID=UPI001F1BE754|nr:peptide-methionine (S)-S-oxide reductase MsrA [Rheinheimera sp. UJ63]MCF4008869.1 peptide-methionine (S)-S-oxide reductase MsrA [Rheinheimera sp. UJ63]
MRILSNIVSSFLFIIFFLTTPLMATTPQASMQLETIVLGAGCFWGVEKRFEAMSGVTDVQSGYAGGNGVEPSYRVITQQRNKFNPNNHAEVVRVTFQPELVSLETLLQRFYEMHDPTQRNRQGNDVGTQYRSAIFFQNEQQQKIAKQVTAQYQPLLTAAGYGEIQTQIQPLNQFFPAEDFHQDYIAKNPNGYCPDHSTGVRFDSSNVTAAPAVDNSALLKGKHIVMIDAAEYCPYCEKFKANVSSKYQGKIPLHYRLASQLEGLTITTPTWATPTLLFIENGVEVFGVQGYMEPEVFYKALGLFSVGADSESYQVAFQSDTDRPFCKQYEIFKNTPDGIFVDAFSGAPLFDTRDRFNSGSGWLSFKKAIDGAVTTRTDYSHGMIRTEIVAAVSGIHLGHRFNDGPNGTTRYCINATVLEFVAR